MKTFDQRVGVFTLDLDCCMPSGTSADAMSYDVVKIERKFDFNCCIELFRDIDAGLTGRLGFHPLLISCVRVTDVRDEVDSSWALVRASCSFDVG